MMIWKVQAAIDVKEETQEKFRLGKKSATKHATNQKKKKNPWSKNRIEPGSGPLGAVAHTC
jgi:hypothetical protein